MTKDLRWLMVARDKYICGPYVLAMRKTALNEQAWDVVKNGKKLATVGLLKFAKVRAECDHIEERAAKE